MGRGKKKKKRKKISIPKKATVTKGLEKGNLIPRMVPE